MKNYDISFSTTTFLNIKRHNISMKQVFKKDLGVEEGSKQTEARQKTPEKNQFINTNPIMDFVDKGFLNTITRKRRKGNIVVRIAEIAMLTFATITAGISLTKVPYFYFMTKNIDIKYGAEVAKKEWDFDIYAQYLLYHYGLTGGIKEYYKIIHEYNSYDGWLKRFKEAGIPVIQDFDSLFTYINTKPRVFVQFSARGCHGCLLSMPYVLQYAKKHHEVFFVYCNPYKKINDEVEDTLKSWNIYAIPTFIYFENGKEEVRFIGEVRDTTAIMKIVNKKMNDNDEQH